MYHYKKIGLLADSHGNLPATVAAIECLQANGAQQLYHLGDLFDSIHDNDFSSIFQLVKRHQVLAVKGNNDYQVERAFKNGADSCLSPADSLSLADYLALLPMKRELAYACMTHSLPYEDVRAFYEPMDDGSTRPATRVFKATDYPLICCGHSHHPVLFTWRAGEVSRERMTGRNQVHFLPGQRYILIVGSVEKGDCGILDFDMNTYQGFRIFNK